MSRKLSFKEQIKHPLWQKRRLEILEKSGWKCALCECDEETLHVHHKQYKKERMYWEYEDHELIVLCEYCHEEIHAKKDAFKEIIDNVDEPFIEELLSFLIGFCGELDQLNNKEEINERIYNPEAHICGGIGAIILRDYSKKSIYDLVGIQNFFECEFDEVIEYLKDFFRNKNK